MNMQIHHDFFSHLHEKHKRFIVYDNVCFASKKLHIKNSIVFVLNQ